MARWLSINMPRTRHEPLIGANSSRPHPFLLYVQTQQGYQNLCQILSTRAEKPAPMLESLFTRKTHPSRESLRVQLDGNIVAT